MDREILEGNKSISEFMEFQYNRFIRIEGKDKQLLGIEDCGYHSSWDWLMPVIEKIGVENKRNIDMNIDYFFEGDIHSVWLAVVDFIKNENLTP